MEIIRQYDKLRELFTYIEACMIEYEKLSSKLIEIRVQRDLHAAQESPVADQVQDFVELEDLVEKQLALVLYTALCRINEFKKEVE